MQRIITYFNRPENHMLARNGAGALLIFITSLLLYLFTRAEGEPMILFGMMIPYSILQYTISFCFLLPYAFRTRRPFLTYLVLVGAILVGTAFPFGMLTFLF